MGRNELLFLGLGLFCCFGSVNGKALSPPTEIFKNGKEFKYAYQGTIAAAPVDVISTRSLFGIHADFVVQSNGDTVTAQLQNVKVGAQTGQLPGNLLLTKTTEDTKAASGLDKPFKINYHNGLVKDVAFAKDDPTWSTNIKKGIISLFQFDLEKTTKILAGESGVETVNEESPNGKCITRYIRANSISPNANFEKNVKNCEEHDVRTQSPVMGFQCFSKTEGEQPVNHFTNIVYKLSESRDDAKPALIEAVSGLDTITFFILGSEGAGNHISFSNLTLNLVETGPISSPIAIGSDLKISERLHYEYLRPKHKATDDTYTEKAAPLFFSSEANAKQEDLSTLFVNTMQTIAEITTTSKKGTKWTDEDVFNMHTTPANTMIAAASSLDLDTLKKLHEKFGVAATDKKQETLSNLWLSILPQIGTNPAALLVIDEVKKGELPEAKKMAMIMQLPFAVTHPNDALLKEVKTLLDPIKDESWLFRKAINNAVGTLVKQTCRYECSKAIPSEIAEHFIAKFEGSTEHEHRMHYFQALSNMGHEKGLDIVLQLIKGVKYRCPNLRAQAFWATWSFLETHSTELVDAIWPVYLNTSEPTLVRNAAAANLVWLAMDYERLQQMAFFTLFEKNVQVKNYVKSIIGSLSDLKSYCFRSGRKNAHHLKSAMGKDFGEISGKMSHTHYFMTYDKRYRYGRDFFVDLQHDGKSALPSHVAIGDEIELFGFWLNTGMIQIRAEGVENIIAKHITGNIDDLTDVVKLDEIFKKLHIKPREDKKLEIEITVNYQYQTVLHLFIDEKKIKKAIKDLSTAQSTAKEIAVNWQKFHHFGLIRQERPTLFGVPAVAMGNLMSAFSVKGDVSKSAPGSAVGRMAKVDLNSRFLAFFTLSNYNPWENSYFGTYDSRVTTAFTPFNANIGIDVQKKQLKFSAKRPSDDAPAYIVTHANRFVYIKNVDAVGSNPEERLKKTCDDCKIFVPVTTTGEKYHADIFDSASTELGVHAHADVFHCENHIGKASIYKIIMNAFKHGPHVKDHTVMNILSAIQNINDYTFLSPRPLVCGKRLFISTDQHNPLDMVEGTIRYQKQKTGDAKSPFQARKYMAKASLSLTGTKPEAVPRKFEANLVVESSKFFRKNAIKLKVYREGIPEKGLKSFVMCYDANNEYPKPPSDYYKVEPEDTENAAHGKGHAVWGWNDNGSQECISGQGSMHLEAKMERTKEQLEEYKKDIWPYKECRDEKKKPEWVDSPVTPATHVCFRAAEKMTQARKFSYDVEYSGLSPEGRNTLAKASTLLKAILFKYWEREEVAVGKDDEQDNFYHAHEHDDSSEEVEHGKHSERKKESHEDEGHSDNPRKGRFHLSVKFRPSRKTADVRLNTSYERNIFKNVDYSLIENLPKLPGLRYSKAIGAALEKGYMGICNVDRRVVRTLDSASFEHALTNCYTMVSGDCTHKPFYGVFVKKLPSNLLAMKIFFGGDELEVIPKDLTSNTYEITVNGETKIEKDSLIEGYSFPPDDLEYPIFKFTQYGPRFIVISPPLKLRIVYMPSIVKIFVPSQFRGEHCGLCGNFDDNPTPCQDFIGPQNCKILNPSDLTHSYTLKDDTCNENIPDVDLSQGCQA